MDEYGLWFFPSISHMMVMGLASSARAGWLCRVHIVSESRFSL